MKVIDRKTEIENISKNRYIEHNNKLQIRELKF